LFEAGAGVGDLAQVTGALLFGLVLAGQSQAIACGEESRRKRAAHARRLQTEQETQVIDGKPGVIRDQCTARCRNQVQWVVAARWWRSRPSRADWLRSPVADEAPVL